LKDFKTNSGVVEGLLFDDNFKLILEPKKTLAKAIPDELTCPKCQKGTVKGKMAYGAVIINQLRF
jgi:DNA topoisomerase-3